MRQPIVAIGLLLLFSSTAAAESSSEPSSAGAYSSLPLATASTAPAPSAMPPGPPAPSVQLVSAQTPVLVAAPVPAETQVVVPSEPYIAPSPNPIGEPPWCASPYKNSAWRIQFDVIPTTSTLSDGAFGNWDDNTTVAGRLALGYEGCDGIGTRLQFWGLSQQTETLIDDVDFDASTFYWDFYKRFFVDHAELVFGGGLAGSHLEYKLHNFGDNAEFSGGGLTIFGEGFYPLCRFERTDIGSVIRGRVALMDGEWKDNGMPFIGDTDHDTMTIFELGWGLELRHRFGPNEEKYWYVALVPEFQKWDSASLPNVFDPSFQGTNISFGLAW